MIKINARCFIVEVNGVQYVVKSGKIDDFICLFLPSVVIIQSMTTSPVTWEHSYQWYSRISKPMTAKDYLTAMKVIREIQRKQAYRNGTPKPFLAETLKTIELYCPLDFSKSGGRVTDKSIMSVYNGILFSI